MVKKPSQKPGSGYASQSLPKPVSRSKGYREQAAYENVLKPKEKRAVPVIAPKHKPAAPAAPVKPRSKLPLWISGIGFYCIAVYGIYVYAVNQGDPIPSKPVEEQEDKRKVFDEIAKDYDQEMSSNEWWMGMLLLRRSLARRAEGDVLEASAGTGRNMKYYKMKNVNSITFVDTSSPMLEIAKQAFKEHQRIYNSRARFIVQDAASPIRTPSGDKFDTVLQTMGICSHHSPVQLLRSLGDACKPEGTIILLEHGRSHYDWLNRILDRYADKHADTWGCWWNRDIEGILSQSGLRVNKLKRYHFGTTYWIEAQPALKEAEEVKEVVEKK